MDGEGQGAMLRNFGPDGRFLLSAGGAGGAPGEFRDPTGLAPLPDGLMALRDGAAPHRITIYRPDGEVDTIWPSEMEKGTPHTLCMASSCG